MCGHQMVAANAAADKVDALFAIDTPFERSRLAHKKAACPLLESGRGVKRRRF